VVSENEFNKKFDYLYNLGEGSFGEVKLVQEQETEMDFAMKTVPPASSMCEIEDEQCILTYTGDILNEAEVQERVESEHVVGLYNTFRKENGEVVFLTEFLPDGELLTKLRPGVGGLLGGLDVRETFSQIVDGVKFIHESGVVHLDLKPENIWLKNKKVKIGDFGFAKRLKDGPMRILPRVSGTLTFMSPELHRHWMADYDDREPMDLKKVDVWALGVIFYEMLTGSLAWKFRVVREKDAIKFIRRLRERGMKGVYRPLPASVDPDAQDLLKHMLEPDPDKRFTIHQVAMHPYFYPRPDEDMTRRNAISEEVEKRHIVRPEDDMRRTGM
jgi:calcium/calmodulin-dependent protein kinase I